jgi:hypothetical protein
MKHVLLIGLGFFVFSTIGVGCGEYAAGRSESGWIALLDGTDLNNWTMIGKANWRLVDDVLQADQGSGYLVSKNSYTDFQIRAEFWVDDVANSGILIRCPDAQKIGSATCYEANIYDQRAEQDYSTGAIVNVAKVASPFPKAGGRWNIFEITAKGPQMSVVMNGVKTAEGSDGKFPSGRIAIQYGAGVVRFRKLEIRLL